MNGPKLSAPDSRNWERAIRPGRTVTGWLRRYLTVASTSVQNRLAYPAGVLGLAITYALFVFVFASVWTSASQGKTDIAGYTLVQLGWYFMIAELSIFGAGRFFFALSREFRGGAVAYQISRPYSLVFYHMAERLGPVLTESLGLAVIGSLIAWAMVGPLPLVMPLVQLASLLLSFLLAASIQFLLQFCLVLLVFWTEENTAFFWIYQKLTFILGAFLPLQFLPDQLQAAVWFSPFPAITYAPARILTAATDGTEIAGLLGFQACWLVLAGLLCALVWSRAKRRLSVQGG